MLNTPDTCEYIYIYLGSDEITSSLNVLYAKGIFLFVWALPFPPFCMVGFSSGHQKENPSFSIHSTLGSPHCINDRAHFFFCILVVFIVFLPKCKRPRGHGCPLPLAAPPSNHADAFSGHLSSWVNLAWPLWILPLPLPPVGCCPALPSHLPASVWMLIKVYFLF